MKVKVGATEKTITAKTARDIAAATKNQLLETKVYDIGTGTEHSTLIAALQRKSRPYIVAIISPK